MAHPMQMATLTETKVCRTCGRARLLSEFRDVVSKHGQRKTYKVGTCKACVRDRAREGNWRKAGMDITVEEYVRLLEAQAGVCAICGQPERAPHPKTKEPKALHVDHDHETGAIRGLLCTTCNVGMGALREDPALFAAALAYLERGKSLPPRERPAKRKSGTGSRTHCRHGHPWTARNTYLDPEGARQCRVCRRIAKERWRSTGAGVYEDQGHLPLAGGG